MKIHELEEDESLFLVNGRDVFASKTIPFSDDANVVRNMDFTIIKALHGPLYNGDEQIVRIDLIKGHIGLSLRINDIRICGPQPLSGEKIMKSWNVKLEHIMDALK